MLPSAGRAGGYGISLSSGPYLPGDTVHAVISNYRSGRKYSMEFMGRRYGFVKTGSHLECYVGIGLDAEPGEYDVKINESGRRLRADVRNIRVDSRKFEVREISFSPKMRAKIGSPVNRKERKLIDSALSEDTAKKLWEGTFSMPAKGRISGVFGTMRKSQGQVLWRHKGVDIAAPEGTQVFAPAAGRVILVGKNFNLHGNTVMIDHGLGVVTIYIHLSSVAVDAKQQVEAGQLIGAIGSTGLTTAPNLHWGVYVHSVAVDPLRWIGRTSLEHE